MLTWRLARIGQSLLTEHDVARAHIAAPHVLRTWETQDARHWRSVLLSLAIGALLPLLGCLLLDWSPGLLVLALTLDAIVLWLCEALKGGLAWRRVAEERAHFAEADDALAIIEGLERPVLPRDRDLFAPPPPRRLYYRFAPPPDPNRILPWYGLITGLPFLVLCFLLVRWLFPAAAPWLIAGATLRIGISALRTLRASRDPNRRPELLNEAELPTLALICSLYPLFLLLSHIDIDLRDYDPRLVGGIVLGIYFAAAALLAWRGWRRVDATAGRLRAFIARDRAQLQARVRQINGADA